VVFTSQWSALIHSADFGKISCGIESGLGGLTELIESYDFGRIVVDGVVYTSDVIIMGKKVVADWWRNEGHVLHVSDLSHVLKEFLPEVTIIGTGYMGMMKVPKGTGEYFRDKGVELLIERTSKACDLFNVLPKTKRALAALHLTC
jgi:hypothetical protein